MPRFFSAVLLLCLTFNAQAADSYITRLLNKPVPGGVAVIELGSGAQAPKASYDGKPVMVIKEQDTWRAIVGIPLTVKPGSQQITSGGRNLSFAVGSKKYPEQHITLKNKRQVNPDPADIKRIDNELAIQIKAYRTFSPNTPSNLLLDKPVNGPLSSKFGVRRFFNGEERNPHAGLDFAVPAGTPIKTPAAGKVIQWQYGVCRSRPGLYQHVLPYVEDRHQGRPATGPRRCGGQGRLDRPRHGPAYALERQPQ